MELSIAPALNRVRGTSGIVVPLCDLVMRQSLYVLIFALPLLFTQATDEWFSVPKVTLLRTLTILALVAWGIKAIRSGELKVARTGLELHIAAYLGANVAATLHSISPTLSLYGLHFRQDGLFTVLIFLLLPLLAVNVFSERGQVRRAMELQVLGGSLISVIGVLQHLGFRVLGLDPNYFGRRVFSTLGNPDFLGTYLVLTAPLAVGLLLTAGTWRRRCLWAAALLLLVTCLLYTFTRGAWLGAGFAFLGIAALSWRQLLRQKFWLLGVAMVMVGVLVAAEWNLVGPLRQAAPDSGATPDLPSVTQAVGSMAELGSGTAEVRLLMWRGSLSLIAENPLLGTGLNTFMPAFSRYAPVEYARGEGLERFPDKAHNDFLNTAVTMGLVGLGSYLWLLGAFAWRVWGWLRDPMTNGSRPLVVSLAAAWLGYLGQSLFLFPVIDTGTLFWMQMGMAVALLRRGDVFQRRFALPSGASPLGQGLVLALGGVLVFFALKPLVADLYSRQAQKELQAIHSPESSATPRDRASRATQLARQALSWNPNDDLYYRRVAASLQLQATVSTDPVERRRHLDEAVRYLSRAIDLNPGMAGFYYLRGKAYEAYETDHLLDALADFRKAAELFPNYYNGNAALSAMAHRLGLLDEAIIAQRQILRIFPHSTSVLFDLGRDYVEVGRTREAIAQFKEILKFEPGSAEVHFWLGMAYARLSDRESAVAEAKAALAINPEEARYRALLDSLEGGGEATLGRKEERPREGGD